MSRIKETLEFLNPWWNEARISESLAKSYKRSLFEKIKSHEKYRQIIILSGLRRVGKTTLLYQTIEDLLLKIDPKDIFYFSFDKQVSDLLDLFKNYKELTNVDYKTKEIFVFFDEITKFKGWASELKLIYDSCPNIKFYISSSSSINLEEDAIKNLAGRYFLININPLNFREFLELRGKYKLLEYEELNRNEIKSEFSEYLLKNFPENINWTDNLLIKDYLRSSIIDKIIKNDLPERFENINKDLLYNLINLIFTNPGIIIDYDSLSKNLKISKTTLNNHLFYLEFCYLIKIIKNYRPSMLSSSRKLQKAYPYWWTFSYCYDGSLDKRLEAFVISTLNGKYYWREKEKEIDLLVVEDKKIFPIEVKNKEFIEERELNSLKYFMKKYNVRKSGVIYSGDERIKKGEYGELQFFQFYKWALKQ